MDGGQREYPRLVSFLKQKRILFCENGLTADTPWPILKPVTMLSRQSFASMRNVHTVIDKVLSSN